MQMILPGLFLGPYAAAKKTQLDFLSGHGITHIVCVRQDNEKNIIKPNFEQHFKYLVVEMLDSQMYGELLKHVIKVNAFIRGAIDGGGAVLVHGNIGATRSACLVMAYCMDELGMESKDAFAYVYSRRGCVTPYESFLQQLCELEPILKARADVEKAAAEAGTAGAGADPRRCSKRPLEPDEDDVEMADTTVHARVCPVGRLFGQRGDNTLAYILVHDA